MIEAWLDLSIPWLAIVAATFYVTSAILLNWLSHHSPLASWFGKCKGVVGPFFVSVSLFFGFFLTFLAVDVWNKKIQAAHVVHGERDALVALTTLAATNAQLGTTIKSAVDTYVAALVDYEWPRMQDQQSSPEAATRLKQLISSVASSAPQYPTTVHQAMLQKALAASDSRSQRLSISQDKAETLKWLSVIVLALLTQTAIAVVHLEHPNPQRAALAIFTFAAVFTICIVAVYERPFDGPIVISVEPLSELLASSAAEGKSPS